MKYSISIPESIHVCAESIAKSLGISVNQLYVEAVEAYIEAHREQSNILDALNRVYSHQPSSLDESLAQAQWASLTEERWQ